MQVLPAEITSTEGSVASSVVTTPRPRPEPVTPQTPHGLGSSYFAPVFRPAGSSAGLHAWGKNRAPSFLRLAGRRASAVFLVGRVEARNVAAWSMAYHYAALALAIFALTVNCLLHVFLHIVFPIMAAEIGRPGGALYTAEGDNITASLAQLNATSFFSDGVEAKRLQANALWTAVRVLASRAGLFMGVVVLAYKTLCHICDCALDITRYVVHDGTRTPLMMSQLHRDLAGLVESPLKMAVFFALLIAQGGALFLLFFTDTVAAWSTSGQEREMIPVATALFGLQLAFITAELIIMWVRIRFVAGYRHTEDSFALYWSRRAHWYPCSVVAVMLAAAVLSAVDAGFVYGTVCFSEGMLCMACGHLCVAGAARLTRFAASLGQTLADAWHDPLARVTLLTFAVPTVAGVAASWFLIEPRAIVLLQLPVVLLLVESVACHAREHNAAAAAAKQRTGPGSPEPASAIDEHLARLSFASRVWAVSLKAFFLAQRESFSCSPHFRHARVLRVALRLFMAVAITVVGGISFWVGLQFSPDYAASGEAHCRRNGDNVTFIDTVSTTELGPAPATSALPRGSALAEDPHRHEGLCQRHWAHGLRMPDMAFFAGIMYTDEGSDDFDCLFDFYRRYRRDAAAWQSVSRKAVAVGAATELSRPNVTEGGELARQVAGLPWPRGHDYHGAFHHFHHPGSNVSVIAVRGTEPSAALDVLQNVLVFSEVFLVETLAMLLPGLGLLPESIRKDLIAFGALLGMSGVGSILQPHLYHVKIARYIEAYAALRGIDLDAAVHTEGQERIVLTGHSLGGAVAQLVAAKKRLHAVAFSSPGIVLIETKFGLDPGAVDGYSTNVVPSNDPVVRVGKLSGTVHHVQCADRRPGVCHSASVHLVRLLDLCPSYTRIRFPVAYDFKLHTPLRDVAIRRARVVWQRLLQRWVGWGPVI